MLTLRTSDQIGEFTSEDIVDDFLLANLLQIPLQLIHEGVEELVDVSLDARIDGLPFQDELFAERGGVSDGTLRELQMSEDILQL